MNAKRHPRKSPVMIVAKTTDTHYGWDHNTDKVHRKKLVALALEMQTRGCRVLLHTGDWSCVKQKSLFRAWALFREILGPDVRILSVRGNHDFWFGDEGRYSEEFKDRTWEVFFARHREHAALHNIELLSDTGSVVIHDVWFGGFDGWYEIKDAPTNDRRWMLDYGPDGQDVFVFMQQRAEQQFQAALDAMPDDKFKVLLTHMPLVEGKKYKGVNINGNPRWFDHLVGKIDALCWGHTHEAVDYVWRGVRCVNAGSGYNSFQYYFMEVGGCSVTSG